MKERQTMHLPSKGKESSLHYENCCEERPDKVSKFVVGCMQETVGKSWGKERLEETAIRKYLEDMM